MIAEFAFTKKGVSLLLGLFPVLCIASKGNLQDFSSLLNTGSRVSLPSSRTNTPKILNAGFVCVEKVYNSELMAPYDVLQHSVYRDSLDWDLGKVPHVVVKG